MRVEAAVAALVAATGGEFELPGIPGVTFVDLCDPAVPPELRARLFKQLVSVHTAFFDDYPHVCPEWRDEIAGRPLDPETDVHLWLAISEGQPAGEVILHTNRRRGVVLVHFVAMTAPVRRSLPRDWLVALGDGFEASGVRDVGDAPLLAVVGEVPAAHVHKWRPSGFAPLDVGYVEPRDGRSWRSTGREELRRTTPVLRLTPAGSQLPYGQVAAEALRAFALDYYDMDAGSPECTAMVAAAEDLTAPADVE